MIHLTLETRYVSKQRHSLIKIASEKFCMSTTYWFVKLVLSLRENQLEDIL